MAKRIQYQRLVWLGLLLCLAFAGLGYRLVDLQVLRHEELSAKAQENTQHEYVLEPRRGDILDVKGNLLATSVFLKQVCADPSLLGTNQVEVAHLLAPLLQTNENRLVQLLLPVLRRSTNGIALTNRYVCLAKRVPLETWSKIQAGMNLLDFGVDEKKCLKAQRVFYQTLRQKAIFAEDEQIRTYPNQSMAAHVLGYTAVEEHEVDHRVLHEIVGRNGIELSFNDKLAGSRGWRLTETDRSHREVVTLREQDVEPEDGLNVVLTIDSVIQHIVETALAEGMEKNSPISISGIVIRPRTGEILAMANLPTYDPNEFSHFPMENLMNRSISEVFEPGSTFKIVVVSAALNEGLIRLTDTFDCEHGLWVYAGRKLRDHERYGILSAEQIITKSSNIGAAKIGLKLGEDRLYQYIRDYGFGQKTGLPLLGEVRGIVHPVKAWTKVSIAQIPMGQGLAVTRLQMAMAMCALANHGRLMQPMLVDHLEDRDHSVIVQYYPPKGRQVVSETACKSMVEALKTVVSPEGTAPKAVLDHYKVAGKTGTAQKAENGFYVNKFFSSFIGFFPADDPQLCVSVTLDEPKQGHYGGAVAGPIFKQIALAAANYLNIRPDDAEPAASPDKLASPVAAPPTKTAILHAP